METRTITITLRTEIPTQDLAVMIQQMLRDHHIIPSSIQVS